MGDLYNSAEQNEMIFYQWLWSKNFDSKTTQEKKWNIDLSVVISLLLALNQL